MQTQSLKNILCTFLSWHPARIETYCELIFGIIKAKSVTIKELAKQVSSCGKIGAKIAKVERLFTKQAIDYTAIGQIIIKLLGSHKKWCIAIDRTNWQFGKKNLNFLVASVIWGAISIPLVWILLDKKGNSSTKERIELIEQILKIMPASSIEMILADREFIGADWMEYLNYNKKIAFAIRAKVNEQMRHPNGGKMKFGKYFAGMGKGEMRVAESKVYKQSVKITCLQLETEKLIIISNVAIGAEALIAYKQRWAIERTFKSLKTSGFNIEDTHITDLEKLRKLFSIAAIAIAICVVAGEIKAQQIPIKIKKHGRRVYSLFTYGFDWLNEYFSTPKNNYLKALFRSLKNAFLFGVS
jgi:hypothetical protein